MRKKVLSWLGTFLILAGTMFPAVRALAEQVDMTATTGEWSLSSDGAVYSEGNTTWTYTISRTGRPHQLGHLDLTLCNGLGSENVDPSHGGIVGPDEASGLPHVIRWDASSLRGTTTLRVTYEGLWATGSQSWYMQAGSDVYSGSVDGPTCNPLDPDFQITKAVSAINDPATGESSLTLEGGGTAYYFYTITNTGNTRLSITSAVDDKLGEIGFPGGHLKPGETVSATASKSFAELAPGSPPQTEVNTVTATASFAGITVGPRAASATVVNLARAADADFTIEKRVSATNNPATGQDSITLEGGGTAYYFYTVTNTGNVPLTITGASDDKLGELNFTPSTITVGGTATASMAKVFEPPAPGSAPETETNTVSVTVSHDQQTFGPKTDTASVTVNPPAGAGDFTVIKKVSDVNDPATGRDSTTLTGGGVAYYFYTVTNTGDLPITISNAVDDKLGDLTFSPTTLNPGESATATASKEFPALAPGSAPVQEINIVVVSVTCNRVPLPHKSDTAKVINMPPAETGDFTVEKLVSEENSPGTGAESITLVGGGTAHYFYRITNTGDRALTIDSAVDDQLGAVSFDATTLAPGQSAVGTKSKSFPQLAPGADPETEINVLTVEVTYDDGESDSRSDSATVINEPPAIDKDFSVVKKVSDQNDPATGHDSITLTGGGTAYYFYTVTNAGNQSMTISSAVDDKLGSLSFSSATLAPGQSATATRSKSFGAVEPGSPDEVEVNTVTVTAAFPDRTSLTRSDDASVLNRAVPANPDFDVTKRVGKSNDPSQAGGSLTLTGGGKAYYFYTVTNTGNVPLTITSASDDRLGDLTFTPTVIPVGGTATATANKTFPALTKGTPSQTEVNTVVVTVTHPHSTSPLSRSDQATVVNKPKSGGGGGGGGDPPTPTPSTSFTVTKLASTVNDASTGQELVTLTDGGTVFYFYTVRNTGETPFTIETATDDKLGALTFQPGTLQPGESATATAQKIFGAPPPGAGTEAETNLVSVTIRNERGLLYGPLTDQATVMNQATSARADFTVAKRVSTSNDPATGKSHLTLPSGGGNVYYFYTVTNTGTVPLSVTEALDDKLGAVSLSPSVIQPGGSATGVLTRSFGQQQAGQTETNLFTVKVTHGGITYGPKSDSASVQVAARQVGSLEVRVRDGSPRNNGIFPMIPGAVVTLSNGMSGTTDSAGRILFTDLPFDEYEAGAASFDPQNPVPSTLKSGSGTATLTPATPDEVITITLAWEGGETPPTPRAPRIVVAVCQSFTLMGGEVLATGPNGATATGELQADGTYLLKELTAGSWTVTLLATGLTEPVSQTIYLRDDNDVPNNAYHLDLSGACPAATGAIIGRICSPKRPGALIQGLGPNGESTELTIPSNGRLGEWRDYRLDFLAEGEWKLTLTNPDSQPVSQTVMVKAREVTRANDFTLACTGQSGLDFAGIWYYLTGGLMVATGLLMRRWARAF